MTSPLLSRKIVRLEDIQREDTSTTSESDKFIVQKSRESTILSLSSPEKYSTSSSSQSTAAGGIISLYKKNNEDDDDIISESEDSPRMPDNWPKIPELCDKKQLQMTTAVSTTVNKASAHLELLQNIIEEWFEDKDSMSRQGRKRSHLKLPPDTASTKRQIHFTDEKLTTVSRTSSGSTPQLEIYGVAGTPEKEIQVDTIKKTLQDEIPYLGADEVIEEAYTLLARLENDRQETEMVYKKERKIVEKLGSQIDALARMRMVDLPGAVQREHEACARDIFELQWHVSYKGRSQDRMNHRVEIAQTLHKKLQDDIAFVKDHCPLVKEKLILEKEAMERIEEAQRETTEELNVTMERCDKVNKKSIESHAKADMERRHMKNEIESVGQDLDKIKNELALEENKFKICVQKISETQEILASNEADIENLKIKEEEARQAEFIQEKKVTNLELKINEQEKEHTALYEENVKLQGELELQRNKHGAKENDLKKQIEKKEEEFMFVKRISNEFQMDIDDFKRKILDCENQKIAGEKNMARIHKEMEKTHEQMIVTMEEFYKVQAMHSAIMEKMRSEEEKNLRLEDQLKNTAENLKKQVKEEIHARSVLQSRITTDNTDLVNSKGEFKHKKEKLKKMLKEMEVAVKSILGKVEKLRATHGERSAVVNSLEADLQLTKDKHREVQERLEQKIRDLTPHSTHLITDILALNKKLDNIDWQSKQLNNKIEEMDASAGMMTKIINNTEAAIKNLTIELDELTIRYNTGQSSQDSIKESLNQAQSRVRNYENQQQSHMDDRNTVLQKLIDDLTKDRSENKTWASKYRKLQNDHYLLKNKLMDHYEERLRIETALKDLKKLRSLQTKLHAALSDYYKYRSMYNKSELSRMENESFVSGVTVTELQDQMNKALENVTEYLTSQMDQSAARRIAAEAVKRVQTPKDIVNVADVVKSSPTRVPGTPVVIKS
ncbi:coiled-coil domain-containing protein 178-like isoform X2 [Tubulanus polymorphus]|uniref:coiled-coil domain-containing protein 178-like isoform X2 n=1 Tax=Tubulanus polymorphus TaxID=672921 RepID=UPI003DA5C554